MKPVHVGRLHGCGCGIKETHAWLLIPERAAAPTLVCVHNQLGNRPATTQGAERGQRCSTCTLHGTRLERNLPHCTDGCPGQVFIHVLDVLRRQTDAYEHMKHSAIEQLDSLEVLALSPHPHF